MERVPWQDLGSSQIAYSYPYFRIREDQVIRPDGSRGVYGYMETNGSAAFIVPATEGREIYLVRNYRYPIRQYSWEIPAGFVEPGDLDPLVAAKRELQEETGLVAGSWEELGISHPMNGSCSEVDYYFLARDLRQTGRNEQAEEGISGLMKVPFRDVIGMINKGEITDNQTITAIAKASWGSGFFQGYR